MAALEEAGRPAKDRKVLRRRAGDKQSNASKNEDAAERKAALEAAIRKKIEYERKALEIVERLLEDDITEEFLVDCAKFITPSHYKDVVEERFIIKLCGYPMCQHRLQNVPKQKYKISTKTNKVYDITERKCFCSNFCYRASKYFEGQISKSPVWLREEERPPDIELLKDGESGRSGKEIKFISEAINTSDIENPASLAVKDDSFSESESSSEADQEFVSSFLQEDLLRAKKSAQKAPRKSQLKKNVQKVESEISSGVDTVDKVAEQLRRCNLGTQDENQVILDNSLMKTDDTSLNISSSTAVQPLEGCESYSDTRVVFLGVSQKGAEQLKRLLIKSKQPVTQDLKSPIDPLAVKNSLLEGLKITFTEWKTEETLKLLYGSAFTTIPARPSVLPADHEKEDLDEDDLDSADYFNDAASKLDGTNWLNHPLPFQHPSTESKPLPSYEKLKEEASQLKLKVKEFYKGKFTIEEENLETQSREQQPSNDQDVHRWTPALPLVDSSAQHQIRTRIVLEKLRKVLPAVLGPLQIPLGEVYNELKRLVKTFRFTNTNIIHKTPVWTLITVVLLSVLSQNIPIFASYQQNKSYTQFLTSLLEQLHFTLEDFESLTKTFRSDYFLDYS
uniref:RNA polymerase II subunit B1 CTD phosphatase RPAP2 homolog n=1 Tax=Salvator merianae TaxID=96440 RepID=A0A8D0E861_SALMN